MGQRDVGPIIWCRAESAADVDSGEFGSAHVLLNRRDDVFVDIADGGDQADGEAGLEETACQPVAIGIDGKAADDLVADDDDARFGHAPHNDIQCPDPPTNAARASNGSPGGSFLSAKRSLSPSSTNAARPDGRHRASSCSTCSTRPPVCPPAS